MSRRGVSIAGQKTGDEGRLEALKEERRRAEVLDKEAEGEEDVDEDDSDDQLEVEGILASVRFALKAEGTAIPTACVEELLGKRLSFVNVCPAHSTTVRAT